MYSMIYDIYSKRTSFLGFVRRYHDVCNDRPSRQRNIENVVLIKLAELLEKRGKGGEKGGKREERGGEEGGRGGEKGGERREERKQKGLSLNIMEGRFIQCRCIQFEDDQPKTKPRTRARHT